MTYNDVPAHKCFQKQRNKYKDLISYFYHLQSFSCETEYRIVEDTVYQEECNVDIQHVCQEHIKHPLQVQYPMPSEVVNDDPRNPHFIGNQHHNPHAFPQSNLFQSHQPDPYALSPQHVKVSEHRNPKSQPGSILQTMVSQQTKSPKEITSFDNTAPDYAYDPTPGSKF